MNMSAANFNGQKPTIDLEDAVMLLIDHQSGLFQTVQDMAMPSLRANAAALAKMASLSELPVITTASVPQGPNGPLIPEIHQNAPHAKYVARKGEISAWDNPDFVAAVKATGKKTLIIAGTITSVCMALPAIAAVHEGYKVFVVVDEKFPTYDRTTINSWEDVEFRSAIEATGRKKLILTALWTEACLTFPALDALKAGYEIYVVADAVGGTSVAAHEAGLRRIEQAGGKIISVPQLFCELQRDWSRKETVPAFMDLFIQTGGTAGIQFSYDWSE